MKLNKIVKTTLVCLAIVGATLSAGCGGPKTTKDMTFDELMDDWGKNIETVVSERDKMIDDYIKKDPEGYKILTIEKKLNSMYGEKEIDALSLTKDQIEKADKAVDAIEAKTKPQVDKIKEEEKMALAMLEKRQLDKDQNKLGADSERRLAASQATAIKVTCEGKNSLNRASEFDATRFGRVKYNTREALLWQKHQSDKK